MEITKDMNYNTVGLLPNIILRRWSAYSTRKLPLIPWQGCTPEASLKARPEPPDELLSNLVSGKLLMLQACRPQSLRCHL